jgi:hypothetical protein
MKYQINKYRIFYSLGDANGLDEPEFFRKLHHQPSHHFNAQNSNLDLDSMKKKL